MYKTKETMIMNYKKSAMGLIIGILSTTLSAETPDLNILPTMYPQGGTFVDQVKVGCTFPEGSTGVYFFNGSEIKAQPYNDSIIVDHTSTLSVAGVNKEGRIITDVVTCSFEVNKNTKPWVTPEPAEGIRETSFYVTKLVWNNATQVSLELSDFKSNGSRYGTPVVWLTDAQNNTLSTGDYNAIWEAGLSAFKVYLYKNYKQPAGEYDLHVADGIFMVDGARYMEELSFHYTVTDDSEAPIFSPTSGTYESPLTVTIDYPTNGSAFYALYKLDGGAAKAYTGPIVLEQSATIEAYGMNEDFDTETRHVTATYVLTAPSDIKPLAAPVVTRMGNSLQITAEEGATIKFWTDDHMQNAALYQTPIALTKNIKLSCVAYIEQRVSEVTDLTVTDLPADSDGMGDIVFKTPADVEEMHLEAFSANGRYAVGYSGMSDAARGFIWDLSADIITYPSRAYANQLWSISNDGTAYGWRMNSTDSNEPIGDDQLLWGTCKNGVWTPQPAGMRVEGISAEGILMGNVNGTPVTYDVKTQTFTYYEGNGSILALKENVAAGYCQTGPDRHPAIWKEGALTIYTECDGSALLSDNAEWALLGNTHRLHLSGDCQPEFIISTAYQFPNSPRPEMLRGILNDGTCYGTYDETRLSPDKGLAVVFTPDRRWRALSEWMHDEKNFDLKGYDLTSTRAFLGDKSQVLLHAFTQGDISAEPFTRGVNIIFNTSIRHLAPNDVNAEQLFGQLSVKVSWRAPLRDADQVTGYAVMRNGTVLSTLSAQTYEYTDSDIEAGQEYTYAVKALYADGEESAPSYESVVNVMMQSHLPVRNVTSRRVGLNGLKLSWTNPQSTLPRVQYFSDSEESFAFGVDAYDSEWAVRLPASNLKLYAGEQIRAFQFLPTGRQLGYELRLYKGDTQSHSYDAEPFYVQTIDPDGLQYGTVNTVMLDQAQDLPANADLYVALYVSSAGNGDILGVQYEGFRAGYTDLCRVVSVHDTFISIAEESSVSTEIVLTLGVVICNEAQLLGGQVDHYTVATGEEMHNTDNLTMQFEGLADGNYTFSVCAVYKDNMASEPTNLDVTMAANQAAYVAVDSLHIALVGERQVVIEWETPLDDDPTLIHWGDMTPRPGLEMPVNLSSFTAAAIYPNTMTANFGSDYEITAMYFYPTCQAEFALMLHDGVTSASNTLAFSVPSDIELNTINYVKLDTPVQIDPSASYMLSVGVFNVEGNGAPLAYDSSDSWSDGFSNLFLYDEDTNATLAGIVSINEHPNWFIGLEIRRRNSPAMPLLGYHLLINGEQQNSTLLTTAQWTSGTLEDDWYDAQVNVVYSADNIVEGQPTVFSIERLGTKETIDDKMIDGKMIRDGHFVIRKSQHLYNLYGTKLNNTLKE